MGPEMAAGSWVFPLTIVAFFAFLAFWVAANPATPAPGDASLRFARVQVGDRLEFEVTEFYGGGLVAYTTREEFYNRTDFPASPFGVGFDAHPIGSDPRLPLILPESPPPPYDTLLGRRINETYTTPSYPNYWGAWQKTLQLPKTVASLELQANLRDGQRPTPQEPSFNYSQAVAYWGAILQHPLRVGDKIYCESTSPWRCEVLALDGGNHTLTYRRDVREGDRFPANTFLSFARGTPASRNPVVVHLVGIETFQLQWDLEPGDAFVLMEPLGPWQEGAYRVDAGTPETVSVRYAPLVEGRGLQPQAHEIGEPVWFEITVVRIYPRAAPTP